MGAGVDEGGWTMPSALSSNSTTRSPAVTDQVEAVTDMDGTCVPKIETMVSGSRPKTSTASEGTGTFSP
jgi:hypothetical protein